MLIKETSTKLHDMRAFFVSQIPAEAGLSASSPLTFKCAQLSVCVDLGGVFSWSRTRFVNTEMYLWLHLTVRRMRSRIISFQESGVSLDVTVLPLV